MLILACFEAPNSFLSCDLDGSPWTPIWANRNAGNLIKRFPLCCFFICPSPALPHPLLPLPNFPFVFPSTLVVGRRMLLACVRLLVTFVLFFK